MQDLPLRFFIALAMSFLVGLERETSAIKQHKHVPLGVRTYTIVGMLGFACAWLQKEGNLWALPAGMLCVAVLTVPGYLAKAREGHIGWTSEAAALLTFTVGALSMLAELWAPISLGVVCALLLSEKADLEKVVLQLDQVEFLAVIKFLLVTLVILLAMPDTPYTAFQINPRKVWWVVVMVSTVGFVGYFLEKKFGDGKGLWLSGILGGIVSSTAVSIAAGRIAQQSPERGRTALRASLLASCMLYPRVLALLWILRPEYFWMLWWRLALLGLVGLALAMLMKMPAAPPDGNGMQGPQNPFEIRPALLFAALFIGLSILTQIVTGLYGKSGLLGLAAVMGVTDIDPFILSLAQQLGPAQAIVPAAILLAIMSNTMVKGVYFGSLVRGERSNALARFGIWAALHAPLALLVPDPARFSY